MRTCDKILHQECKCAQDSCCCFLPRCVFRRDGAAIKSGAPAPSISVRRLLSFRGVLTAFTLPGVSEVQNVRACSKPFCARHALGLVLGCQRSYFCCRSSQRLRCESAACTFPLIQSEFFGCVLRLLVSPTFILLYDIYVLQFLPPHDLLVSFYIDTCCFGQTYLD